MEILKKLTFKFVMVSLLKAATSVTTILYIGRSLTIGIIGIIALAYFGFEQYEEYKRLTSQ